MTPNAQGAIVRINHVYPPALVRGVSRDPGGKALRLSFDLPDGQVARCVLDEEQLDQLVASLLQLGQLAGMQWPALVAQRYAAAQSASSGGADAPKSGPAPCLATPA